MELNYNEVFGLDESDLKEDNNGSNQDDLKDGDPADNTGDPADGDDGNDGGDNNDPDLNDDDLGDDFLDDDDPEQSPKINSKFASMRRKYEEKIRQAEENAAARAEAAKAKAVDDAIMSMGVVNPYTNKQIANKAELDAYQAQLKEEEENSLREELKTKGVADDELQKFIDHHPDVIKARKEALELETLRKKEQSAANERTIMESVEKIIKDDPSIKGPQDILNHPNFTQIKEKMDRGYSLEDAYYVVNRDKIINDTAAKVGQSVRNNVNSKGHLQGFREEGAGSLDVPSDVMEYHRILNPDATDEEIRADYNRMMKRK